MQYADTQPPTRIWRKSIKSALIITTHRLSTARMRNRRPECIKCTLARLKTFMQIQKHYWHLRVRAPCFFVFFFTPVSHQPILAASVICCRVYQTYIKVRGVDLFIIHTWLPFSTQTPGCIRTTCQLKWKSAKWKWQTAVIWSGLEGGEIHLERRPEQDRWKMRGRVNDMNEKELAERFILGCLQIK